MPFICNGCPYFSNSPMHLKFENNNSKYLLVFQAPGIAEWTGGNMTMSGQRIPIDSISPHSCAERMRDSFQRKSVLRTDYDIAEAVCCYPGHLKSGRDKKPRMKSIKQCTVNMAELLKRKNYTRIACFGTIAYRVVNDAINIIRQTNPNWIVPAISQAPHPSGHVSYATLDSSY